MLAAGLTDPGNFTLEAINRAVVVAQIAARGDKAAFTTAFVKEIGTNIAPNSPIQPAYVLVRAAAQGCRDV